MTMLGVAADAYHGRNESTNPRNSAPGIFKTRSACGFISRRVAEHDVAQQIRLEEHREQFWHALAWRFNRRLHCFNLGVKRHDFSRAVSLTPTPTNRNRFSVKP